MGKTIRCKLCNSHDVNLIYKDVIRNGGIGKYTEEKIPIYQCANCNIIWHDEIIKNMEVYYESESYRKSLEGSSDEENFYKLHDKETLDKLMYTGTEIYRGKIVADIGCGCGAFLDFLKGVSDAVIAIEPSETYRRIMDRKGFKTYAYMKDAQKDWKYKIDVITSFDVIEHVKEPLEFIKNMHELLSEKGEAIIGTPTETPVMRKLLGEIYEKKLLFSTQHLWIFSEKNMRMIADKAGFQKLDIRYFQRYGIGNLMGWLREQKPCSDIEESFITNTLDCVWKNECSRQGMSDYIVFYMKK